MSATSALALDCQHSISKSKSRRLRACNVKRRMWVAANCNTIAFPQMYVPTWWQPEPELTGITEMGDSTINMANLVSQSHSEQDVACVDKCSIEGIALITLALDELNCQLCDLLYGEGICTAELSDVPSLSSSGFPALVHCDAVIEPFEELVTLQDTDMMLMDARQKIAEALRFLRQAADAALEIESRPYSEFDFEDVQENSLQAALMETYFHIIPEGVDKRRARNEEIEQEMKIEERDMQRAMMGYTFTFDRNRFWELVRGVPRHLHKRIVEFGVAHPVSHLRPPLTSSEFERLYFDDPCEANCWQEFYSDNDDEDELMWLLNMFRSIESSK